MMIRIDVAKQDGNPIHAVDHHVDLAVIEDVAKGRAASDRSHRQPRAL